MKKALLFVLALMLCLGLLGCGQTASPKEYTFPENTTVLGLDAAGLTEEDLWANLEAAVAAYTLELTVDGASVSVPAEAMDLACSREAFTACVQALESGAQGDFSSVICFNEGKLRAILSQNFNKPATEASLTYDEASGQYVLVPHADGQESNPNALLAAVRDAVVTLTPSHTLTGVSQVLHPTRSADDTQVRQALELANRMIGVTLAYTFQESEPLEISAETLRSFVILGEDGLTPQVNNEALDAFVTGCSEQYNEEGSSGSFVTTGGSTIGLTVTFNGLYVDNEAFRQDIITCMQEGISGTRAAPYQEGGNRDMPYGGTYVEVDLSSQHLWFYKNGELLVSTPLVSGKVVTDYCTPTGIFSIYSKTAGTYLVGVDYRTYVNYWMPFYYGYGLHDATWRGSFGGSIYLYDGSHGCVNLPLNAAATIFNNAPVGTKVILYGGVRSVPPMDQSFTGTTSYDVADDVGSFQLNIQPKHSDPKMSYKSSNTKVATVSDSGVVTVKSVGTAKITVSVPKHEGYAAAETTVTVNVHSACDEGRHTMGQPETVVEPTCLPGLEKIACTQCDYEEDRELKPSKDHSYGEWVTVKEPTCSQEGTKERVCTVCEESKKTGTIPATGEHTEGEWVTTKEPTCVKEGVRKVKCTVCDKQLRSEKIPATGQHKAGDWKTVQEATCTENGKKAKYCTTCDKELETAVIEAGHKPGDWSIHTEASCSQEGERVKKCKTCKQVLETEVIPKKDHPFDGGPTCPECGENNPNYVPPTEPPATEPSEESSDEEASGE